MLKAIVRVRQRLRTKQKQNQQNRNSTEIDPGQKTQPPSLHSSSGYATPFPPVSAGGYTKYYDTHADHPGSSTVGPEKAGTVASNAGKVRNGGKVLRHTSVAASASGSSSNHTKNASDLTTDASSSSCISGGSTSSVMVEHSSPPTSECSVLNVNGEQMTSYVLVNLSGPKGSQPPQAPPTPSKPTPTAGVAGPNARGGVAAGVASGGRLQNQQIPPIITTLPTLPGKPAQAPNLKSQSQPNAITRFLQRSQTQPKKQAPTPRHGPRSASLSSARIRVVPPSLPSGSSPPSAGVSTPISAISSSKNSVLTSSTQSDFYPPSGYNNSSAALSTQSTHLTIPSIGTAGSARAGSVRSYVSNASSYARRKKVPSSKSLKALKAAFASDDPIAPVPSISESVSIQAQYQSRRQAQTANEDDNDEDYVDESGVEENGGHGMIGSPRALRPRKKRIQLRKSSSAVKRLAMVKEEAAKRNSDVVTDESGTAKAATSGTNDGPSEVVNGKDASSIRTSSPKQSQVLPKKPTEVIPTGAALTSNQALKAEYGLDQKIVTGNGVTPAVSPQRSGQSTSGKGSAVAVRAEPRNGSASRGPGQLPEQRVSNLRTPNGVVSHPPSSFKQPEISGSTRPVSSNPNQYNVAASRTAPPPPPRQVSKTSPTTTPPRPSMKILTQLPSESPDSSVSPVPVPRPRTRLNPNAQPPPRPLSSVQHASLSPPPPRPTRNPERAVIRKRSSNRSMNAQVFRLSTETRSVNSSINTMAFGARRGYGSWVVKTEDLEWVDESDDDDGTASFFSARSKLSER